MKTERDRHGLSKVQKQRMINEHESGKNVRELSKKYGIPTTSIAAYIANAHRR